MIQCKNIAELEYKAYLEELRKGKKVGEAINDAWKKGAPRVFMSYEQLRRHISHRYNHGDYDSLTNKALRDFLDVIYAWWSKNHPTGGYQYLCLLERIEQPAPWPVSLERFKGHIYKYRRGEYKNACYYYP